MDAKQAVADFWNAAACGEALYLETHTAEGYRRQAAERYRLEPHIETLAEFSRWSGKRVLEVGVGLGADHQRFAEAGATLSGIDLTERAIEHTRRRFALLGLSSDLRCADAEALPFPDGVFDLVYSYGVIHHSPNTWHAAREILRVLKPGGELRVMIYHRHSLVGFMLWLRYGAFRRLSLTEVYARYLESPGTKAYSRIDAAALFPGADIRAWTVLTHSDLLQSQAGQRHGGAVLNIARRIWPRWLLKRVAKNFGLHLMIRGIKPCTSR